MWKDRILKSSPVSNVLKSSESEYQMKIKRIDLLLINLINRAVNEVSKRLFASVLTPLKTKCLNASNSLEQVDGL